MNVQSPRFATREHPEAAGLDADLRHTGGWPALSITGSPQTIELVLINRTPYPITTEAAVVSLLFRPGILRDTDHLALAPQSEAAWAMNLAQDDDDGDLRLTFSSASAETLAPGGALVIRLDGVSASEEGGSRATRVQLDYADFAHPDGTEVWGSQLLHLPVLRRHVPHNLPMRQVRAGSAAVSGPFIAGFVGGGGVLNDGKTPNPLKVRILNISGRPVPLAHKGDEATRLHVHWTKGVRDGAWGLLASDGDHLSVNLAQHDGGHWQIDNHTIRRKESGVLPPGGYLDLELTLHTQAEHGRAQLIVTYENLPGHDDGDLVLLVELGPIAPFRDTMGREALRIISPLQFHGDGARLSFHAAEPFETETVPASSIAVNRQATHLGRLEITAPRGLRVDGGISADTLTADSADVEDAKIHQLEATSIDAGHISSDDVATSSVRVNGKISLFGKTFSHPRLSIAETSSTFRPWRSHSDITGKAVSFQGERKNRGYTPILLNPSGGPVGINTSTPQTALHVEGEIVGQYLSVWGVRLSSRWGADIDKPDWKWQFSQDQYALVLLDHQDRWRIVFYEDGTTYIPQLTDRPQ
ncbi:MAG: hypothetical protein AAF557_22590 [Pseudomonadota bacterium]